MVSTYVPLLLLFLAGGLLTAIFFSLTPLLGTKNPNPEKMTPYECGSESTGGRHVKLSVKFYLTAIMFVIFDVEAVFIYPWAIQFRQLGWVGLVTMLGFLSTLALALVYCWKKGALEWEK
ncbi:MAG TPA: NADH-quinone oxidoreductase subunit A [Polyangiaceae bacterium]|jgi:NADH-quinone oxidoreductase subunit A|nr:NADH-quinone oxidoreductase subunit A [Polyangiaceae bacterium]